jgi:hypothetical protein
VVLEEEAVAAEDHPDDKQRTTMTMMTTTRTNLVKAGLQAVKGGASTIVPYASLYPDLASSIVGSPCKTQGKLIADRVVTSSRISYAVQPGVEWLPLPRSQEGMLSLVVGIRLVAMKLRVHSCLTPLRVKKVSTTRFAQLLFLSCFSYDLRQRS